jgi:phenylpropionate dioxygenase-like ring-hydroxylating dioxygenase large terminal subunit
MSLDARGIDYKALVQDDRIHVSLYTDPRIFDDEMERIFTRGWVFVGHASEVPRPGDYVTRRLGREPVIMVRDRDDTIAVLVNRCMHRGTMLCPADRGAVRTFACPYHGWTYHLDGTLLGVPYPGAYASFDKSAHGLRHAARVDSYRGFVFASFAPDGPSLGEHLGRATALIDRTCDVSPEREIELSAGWVKHRCVANWKALPENDSDGYHLGFVHLSLFKTVRSMQYQRVIGGVLGAGDHRSRRRSRQAPLAYLRQSRAPRDADQAAPNRPSVQPGAALAHAAPDLERRDRAR